MWNLNVTVPPLAFAIAWVIVILGLVFFVLSMTVTRQSRRGEFYAFWMCVIFTIASIVLLVGIIVDHGKGWALGIIVGSILVVMMLAVSVVMGVFWRSKP